MPKVYPDRLDALIVLSEGQGGYFTTDQARKAGLSLHALAALQQAGHLEREQYGVYRLARWPASKLPGLWRTFLWATRTDSRATFSHRTALELHEVSDLNPAKIDVTFPIGVRVRATKPPAVVIHRHDIPEGDIEHRDGLRLTKLYRTLLDLATDGLARDAVVDVLDQGGSVGLSPGQIQQVRAIYDLTPETRQYLASSLPRTRPPTRRP
jgi:predicted transcriptional regulator of viral defense system